MDTSNINVLARRHEQNGEWEEARKLWLSVGAMSDVRAIDLIIQATDLGNRYRELSAPIFARYENREINKYELRTLLNEATEKVYGKRR